MKNVRVRSFPKKRKHAGSRGNLLLQSCNYFSEHMILMIFCITVSIRWPRPVVEKCLIHMKRLVAAPALLVLSRALWLTMWLLRSRWWGNRYSRYRGITVFTRQYLCIWACNCKNSQWINLNIYRLTVYLQL